MTSKEKVLSVRPGASCVDVQEWDTGGNWVSVIMCDTIPLGEGGNESEAWDDAASKLPSAPSPAGETASGPDECEGGECWHNPETGYLEACPKHDAIGMDRYMDAEAARRAVPEPVSTEGAAEGESVPPVFNKDRQIVEEVSKLPFSRRLAIYRNIQKAVVAAPIAPAAATCRRAFNAVQICNDDAGHIGPCNFLPSKAGLVIAPAAVSDQRSKTMNHEFWCFSRTGGVCNCAATENAVVSSADLVDIGALRRELFVNYDSPWNGWVRDTTASIETEAGVSRSQMTRKMADYGAVLLHNIGFMRDMQGAKPSAEGDGWIAVTDAAKIVCGWCREGIPIESTPGGIFHNVTSSLACVAEFGSWPYRCKAEAIRLAALPAPPSGQGEVK